MTKDSKGSESIILVVVLCALMAAFPSGPLASADTLMNASHTASQQKASTARPVPEAGDIGWPRDIELPKVTIRIYQPQVESFKGNDLDGRAAVSVTQKGKTEPVFGAVWISAHVATDRDSRTVEIRDVSIEQVRLPDATEDQRKALAGILEAEIPKWDLTISLDRLLTSLDLAEKERIAAENLKNDPPRIVLADSPTVLVILDGQPELRAVENSKLQRVVNTPFVILFDPAAKTYYLQGDSWFKANDVMGPWVEEPRPPAAVVAVAPKDAESDTGQGGKAVPSRSKTPPRIIVATEPTELVVIEGAAKYAQIRGTTLSYVANTESTVFLESRTGRHYILLSGRWYSCQTLNGPWSYVEADQLPADFAKIPPESPQGSVLVHVAGTEQAKEAVLDALIPQTGTLNRSDTSFKAEYDGQPKFESIEGTRLKYAVNTGDAVIEVPEDLAYGFTGSEEFQGSEGVFSSNLHGPNVGDMTANESTRAGSFYFSCHSGAWYGAPGPMGPWAVAVAVPPVIYTIPPACPIYNVTYVRVYGYSSTVVYTGYTSGYVGCYPYGGTVVFGTGYVYPAWYGAYYYPRPPTWGFHVGYNSYTGRWSFGIGYAGSGGWGFAVGWTGGGSGCYRCGSGWWGPSHYYRSPTVINRPININTGDITINRNRNNINADRTRNNIYNRSENISRNAEVRQLDRPQTRERPVARPANPNNVYTDRDGNVYRRTQEGWQQRENKRWSPTPSVQPAPTPSTRPAPTPSTRPAPTPSTRPAPTPSTRPAPTRQPQFDRSQMDREYKARQRGAARTQQFQRQRSPGAARGGGGRRR